MPMVKIRPKGQITIPSEILHAWKMHTEDKVNVNLVNGIVTLTPVKRLENKKSRERKKEQVLKDKEVAVEEKIKKGKKLTTQDLLVFQRDNR